MDKSPSYSSSCFINDATIGEVHIIPDNERTSSASSKSGGVHESIIGNLSEAHRHKGTHVRISLVVCLTNMQV